MTRRAMSNLLELNARVPRILDLAGNVDRPELRADHALLEPSEIRVPRHLLPQVVRLHVVRCRGRFPDCPGEIVVSVDQRRRAQHASGARHVWIGGRRRIGLGVQA